MLPSLDLRRAAIPLLATALALAAGCSDPELRGTGDDADYVGPQGPAGPEGPKGEQGERGPAGPQGERGPMAVLRVVPLASGDECPHGGVRVLIGGDANENGVLDDEEIDHDASSHLCNGQDGTNGTDGAKGETGDTGPRGLTGTVALVATSEVGPGDDCDAGGVRIESGLDTNGDGSLSEDEVLPESVRVVCHGPQGARGEKGETGDTGATGATGAIGLTALARSTALAPGEDAGCAAGGVRIEFGLDENRSGELDEAEIDASLTTLVCNGEQGSRGDQGLQGEQGERGPQGDTGPAGATGAAGKDGEDGYDTVSRLDVLVEGDPTCPTGGVRAFFGTDWDRDGQLGTSEEVPALTATVCNGLVGERGERGPAMVISSSPFGPTGVGGPGGCSDGGWYIQFGADLNGNGLLDSGEQDPSRDAYLCNGARGPTGAKGDQGVQGPTGPQGPQGIGSLDVYGDGSAGSLVIASTTDWVTTPPADLNLQYSSCTINAGATFTVPSGTVIRCQGTFTNLGTLVVDTGVPSVAGAMPDPGWARSRADAPRGGTGIAKVAAASLVRPGTYAGGAGSPKGMTLGGAAGGSLVVRAFGGISNSGTIRANGANAALASGTPGAGGGAGGLIVLVTRGNFTNSGSIQANGGTGSSANSPSSGGGGGGGGGVVHILAPGGADGSISVAGGAAGSNSGTPSIAGGGGGAFGGNGGNGGDDWTGVAPAAGQAGHVIRTTSNMPDKFFF